MSGVLLDTNAYAAYLAGDRAILDSLARSASIALPIVVLGELHAGFRGGGRRADNERLLAQFLARPDVSTLFLTHDTAEIFGEIRAALKRVGRPIPINDVWIAALALETGRVLITLDAHFRSVPGLRLWNV